MIDGIKIGWCICGSFCNHKKTIETIKNFLDKNNVEIIPILSENVQEIDTRFGKSKDFIREIEEITKNKALKTATDVEGLGPKNLVDIVVALPITGNSLAKLACGITDGCVLGAIKSVRRNDKPVVLALSTNDALGINFKNIGKLMETKGIYFTPMFMDDPINKPHSLTSRFDLIEDTIMLALQNKQIQPVLEGSKIVENSKQQKKLKNKKQ